MQVQSLGQEYPLEKEMATLSSILAKEILQTEVGYSTWGQKESDTTQRLEQTTNNKAFTMFQALCSALNKHSLVILLTVL